MIEAQLDGLLAPSHHFGALSFGNKASMAQLGRSSNPHAAAQQALDKMACVIASGGTQLVLPPLYRPDCDFLRSCGFTGDRQQILQHCASEAPHLLSIAQSCAFTWTANCATCIPSSDSCDAIFHFIPANLLSTDHRALEGPARTQMLRHIFNNEKYFRIHDPLPMSPALADEGAANHHRLYNKNTGDYCHLFVHSKAHGMPAHLSPKKFPARQSKEAQASIIRLSNIHPGHSLLITQDPRAIDAGAFHNDVVCAGSGQRLLLHEQTFIDQQSCIAACEQAVPDLHIHVVAKRQLDIEEAVRCYLFNSQFIENGDTCIMLAPQQCQEKRPRAIINTLLKNGFIDDVQFLDLSQSMSGGGGPACLRLRLPLNAEEWAHVPQGIIVTQEKLSALRQWVDTHFRKQLDLSDLADPQLCNETENALDALTQLLNLGSLYAFQQ